MIFKINFSTVKQHCLFLSEKNLFRQLSGNFEFNNQASVASFKHDNY